MMIRIARRDDFDRLNSRLILQEIENYFPVSEEEMWGWQWLQSTFFLDVNEKILCLGWRGLYEFLKAKSYNVTFYENHEEILDSDFTMVYLELSKIEKLNSILIKLYKYIKPGGKIGIICDFDNFEKLYVTVYENLCLEYYNLLSNAINDSRLDYSENMIKILGIGLQRRIQQCDGMIGHFGKGVGCSGCIKEIVQWDENSFLGNLYNSRKRNVYVPIKMLGESFTIDDICKYLHLNIEDSEDIFNELYSMRLIHIEKAKNTREILL